DADALRQSQYEVLRKWQNEYQGNLLVFLPDTFGTGQFLDGAPQWVSYWTGARPDSKDPFEAGEELIGFQPNGGDIAALHAAFAGRVQLGFGWGTNLTNDFLGCHPADPDALRAPSLVCKIETVNGHGAVKLSDNYAKALGPADEVTAYREVFGAEGLREALVKV